MALCLASKSISAPLGLAYVAGLALAGHLSNARKAHTLVLIRHGQSEFNEENRFTGWADVSLSKRGHQEAMEGGRLIKERNIHFDVAYTSMLKRAIQTLWHVLEETDQMFIPVKTSWRLNERDYGALTGCRKTDTVAKFGEEIVHKWRRGFDTIPPAANQTDEERMMLLERFQGFIEPQNLPNGESLKMAASRLQPLWENEIVPDLKAGKKVVIAAHNNILRALIMQLDSISADDIMSFKLPTAVPLVYTLDNNLKPIRHPHAIAPVSGEYLGEKKDVQEKIERALALSERHFIWSQKQRLKTATAWMRNGGRRVIVRKGQHLVVEPHAVDRHHRIMHSH